MVKVNPSVFRAYDIRGTAEPTEQKSQSDLTPETVKLIAKGAATYLFRTYQTRNILVGRDNRLHSEKLQKAFIEGLLESGLDVIDGGLTASPMIYFASCFYQPDCAVNITASHNPKQDNGIKIVQHHAHSVADEELQKIRQLVEAEDFLTPGQPGSPEKLGQLSNNTQIAADYLNKIVTVTKFATTKGRPLKIVLDAGNGVAGPYAPAIFRALQTTDGRPACEVIELFCEPDGNFPNHEANPEHARNMVDLGRKVVETGADLGIGFDGDADRVGIVDEKGRHYTAEFPIMLIARQLLQNHPGEKVIHDVKVNQALIDDIKAHGGAPVMSRVGHSYIERRLHEEAATLAGEKSGHLFFGEKFFNYYGFDDGIFAGVKVAEALSHYDQPISEIFANIPVRPAIPELKISCPDERKHDVIEAVKKHFLHLYEIAPENQMPFLEAITLDGIRLQFSDGAWILARYSNTSPYLTVHGEAPTETRLNEIKELVFDQLRTFPEVKLPD